MFMGLSPDRGHFLLRRLHSLMGIVPLGGFLFFHLFENSRAMLGAESFNEAVRFIGSQPYLKFIEWAFLLSPILYHGIYGVFVALDAKGTLSHAKYNSGGTWRFYLQRASGVLLIAFIAYHVYSTRIVLAYLGGVDYQGALIHEPTYNWMVDYFNQAWWVRTFYALGVTSAAYHLANGLWSFAIVWGITARKASQDWFLRIVSLPVFLVLTGMGLWALRSFNEGGKLVPTVHRTADMYQSQNAHP